MRGAWIEMLRPRFFAAVLLLSRPVRGAWIEISLNSRVIREYMSRPVRGAWIEMLVTNALYNLFQSRPVRGAWIEIKVGAACCVQPRCRAP